MNTPHKSLLSDSQKVDLSSPILLPDYILPNPDREPVQILVVGSEAGITHIVHSLHIHRFAEVYEWSLLLPAPSGRLMRTLTRHVSIR